jgi:DNA-directed RNA polymerase specialized sigma24 family protein
VAKSRGPGAARTDDHDGRLERILDTLSNAPADPDAWRDLLDLMWPSVFAYARDQLEDDASWAEDMCAEAFASCWRNVQSDQLDHLAHPSLFRACMQHHVRAAITGKRHKDAGLPTEAPDLRSPIDDPGSWEQQQAFFREQLIKGVFLLCRELGLGRVDRSGGSRGLADLGRRVPA